MSLRLLTVALKEETAEAERGGNKIAGYQQLGFGSFMILEMGCKLRILSLKFQLKLHNLLFHGPSVAPSSPLFK
jgi:hypothetical protein